MTPTITPRANSTISLRAILVLFSILGYASFGQAQSYTIAPTPFQTALDNSGHIINNACIWTYTAGTTTQIATYSDNAGTPNLNPIRSDSAGRFTAFLSAGTSYKFVYESSCTPPSHGATLRTADNIAGTPSSSATVDVTGTAGEALTAGQVVYLSDGSGGKTAGQWYKGDSANTYSSSAAVSVGMVPASILSAGSGTIRLAGSMTGLTSLTLGTTYYAGTTGALTATQPTNARVIGIADSTSSLVMAANPGIPNLNNGFECFRLTLTTGVPVTTADVTAATTIFAAPYGCNRISLYDSLGNATTYTSAQFSIAVPATTSQMYDVFAFSSSGVPTLELLAWTNDTTRATAIVLTTTGTYTKSGDLTRRYLGSVRTSTVSGQTTDSATSRLLWNYYGRVRRTITVTDATASWVGSGTVFRQVRGNAANQLEVVIGVAESEVSLRAGLLANNATTNNTPFATSIGFDSTTTVATGAVTVSNYIATASASIVLPLTATLEHYPTVGRHLYVWLEKQGDATPANTTFFGNHSATSGGQSGMTGFIEG